MPPNRLALAYWNVSDVLPFPFTVADGHFRDNLGHVVVFKPGERASLIAALVELAHEARELVVPLRTDPCQATPGKD